MKFTDTPICAGRCYCKICRDKHGGRKWRTKLARIAEIDRVDFECPHGKNWGDVGKVFDKSVYDVPKKLGEIWAMANFLITEATKKPIKVTNSTRLNEIFELLDADCLNIQYTETRGAKHISPWGCHYYPTKQKWEEHPPTKKICCHFEANTVDTPPKWDIDEFRETMKDYEIIEIQKDLSISECIQIAIGCDLFIGVSSGIAHVMHSVGIPMYLVTYEWDIRRFHENKSYVFCRSMEQAAKEIKKHYSDGYKPSLHKPLKDEKPICNSLIWAHIANLGGSFAELVRFTTEKKVSADEWERRKQICMSCQEQDTKAERLLRPLNDKYYTCGRFRANPIGLLRDSVADGCGCILNLKWAGKSQECVRKKW